jgi:hypothetical protein
MRDKTIPRTGRTMKISMVTLAKWKKACEE